MTTVQLSTTTESGWSIGQRFGQVEYVESLNPHGRYNERNDPKGLELLLNNIFYLVVLAVEAWEKMLSRRYP